MPDSDSEEVPLDPTADPEMGNRPATKRRLGPTLPPHAPHAQLVSLKQGVPAGLFDRPGRRRRLLVLLAAFAVMLALSSVLDLRRAALNARRSEKVHLALPSDAATALGEETTAAVPPPVPADGAALANSVTEAAAQKSGPTPLAAKLPVASGSAAQHPSAAPLEAKQSRPPVGQQLSAQELKDDVDQLIAHVDQESSTAAAAAAGNVTTPSSTSTASTTSSGSTDTSSSGANAPALVATPHTNSVNNTTDNPRPATGANATAVSEDGRASSEDLFAAAQNRIDALMKNQTMKPYLDVNEMRTLHALALQGSRGDCLQATDPRSGGSLFKTDAEAAGADIEKTDPLWGAWCLFTGWYRSDAMREYVLRARAFRARVDARLAAAAVIAATANDGSGTTTGAGTDGRSGTSAGATSQRKSFDQNAASMDDVLSPEEQTALRNKAELVLPHLHEGDVRYLAALSLQATFGDCAPYASTRSTDGAGETEGEKTEEETTRLRVLTEPLLGRTATRSEGALWGAWCVFTRRKRTVAATQLSERLEILLRQLSQKLSPTANTPVTPNTQRMAMMTIASMPAVALRVR